MWETSCNYFFGVKRAYRGARHCDLRSEAEQEAISIYLPINELLNEIASSAFGPPRNDATTLTICDVAYGASVLPVITYILPAARLGTRNDATPLTIYNVAYDEVRLPSSLIFYLPLRLRTRNDATMLIICDVAYDASILCYH